jgi:hypothetical protein
MAKLSASYHDIDALDDAMRAAMFALFKRYYASVSMELFIRDLDGKTIAILLRDPDGELQGFSTLEVINFETDNGPATALYSGDTIISHHHWGEQQLSYAWCYFAGQIKAQQPDVPLYWFLIVKGHRTYRYLPAFTRKFYPNYRETTPAHLQAIIDQLAMRKFSDAYQANAGILHFPESRGHLRPEWDELSEDITRKPHVAFFLKTNPGYPSGDELVCLTELNDKNMRFVSRTAFIEGMDSCQDGQLSDQASPDIATR